MKRLALLALLALAGCDGAQARPDPAPEPSARPAAKTPESSAARVEVATLRSSSAGLELILPGEVEGSRDALLASSLGGYIEKVHVKSGDKVKAGQTLVRVDMASHYARGAQSRVEVETAERELARAKSLGGAISKAQLEAAEARLKGAKAAHTTMQVQIARSVISAPFAGVAVHVDAEVGEVAAPGKTLVRLVQLDPIKVTVSVSDRDVVALREGMSAEVRLEALGSSMPGVVKHIHPAADLRSRSFLAEIELPNKDKALLPGMIATVKLSSALAADKVVIAQDWLVTKLDDTGVFIDAAGVAEWRSLKLGPVVRGRIVVLDGLKLGDDVVFTGHRELASGDRLLVARKGVCCTDGRVDFQ